jgi:cysteine dioxygenase
MKTRELDCLVGELEEEFAREPRGVQVAEKLASYARSHRDWREFALFDAAAYTRNLIHRADAFEVILLCWNPGQVTPIHNHQGQRCWMSVLDGRVEETLYRLPERTGGPLAISTSKLHDRGEVAFITDEIALHRIAQVGERQAVSLHVYSRPIPRCQIYDPASGEVTMRVLAYHSIRGVLEAGASSARCS